jgi:hypothetical protein
VRQDAVARSLHVRGGRNARGRRSTRIGDRIRYLHTELLLDGLVLIRLIKDRIKYFVRCCHAVVFSHAVRHSLIQRLSVAVWHLELSHLSVGVVDRHRLGVGLC